MAIIELCKATDESAKGMLYSHEYLLRLDGEYVYAPGPSANWTRETHIGRCIRAYERNRYDDSDFWMIVWDDVSGKPIDVMYGSTRFWSYPCYGSYADATPEVLEKYRQWETEEKRKRKEEERLKRVRSLLAVRSLAYAICDRYGVDRARGIRLRKLMEFDAIAWLLTANIRSNFKKSLREQALRWLRGESDYSSPLSPKQISWVKNRD